MADIRASVRWKNSTVFAGEDIECTIIFKNISEARSFPCSPTPSSELHRQTSNRERWKETLPRRPVQNLGISHRRTSPSVADVSRGKTKTHRSALSLTASNKLPITPLPISRDNVLNASSSADNKHRRSVSIVAIGGEDIDNTLSLEPMGSLGQVSRGHVRAASLQVLPRKTFNANYGSQPGSYEIRYLEIA